MKKINLILALFLLFQVTGIAQDKVVKIPSKTYAELSIKEGGKWVGQKYEGGTFTNVSELKVPKSHWDHSYFIRYEGPGWESNKIAYRLYLDWRNCIDIFGKVTDTLVLSKVGLDGFESYHHMSPWGMDILKAGKSLGVGSIGRYSGSEVLHFQNVDSTYASVANNQNESTVRVKYKGWQTNTDKINFQSTLTIKPNNRYTKHSIKASKKIEGICTGIVKFKNIDKVIKKSTNNKWSYMATYGKQSLVPDNLGMAIFYKNADVKELKDAEFDHLILFKPTKKEVSFYLLGAWEQEKEGIKTSNDFYNYIDQLLEEFSRN
jgi:hypothetical protein